MRAKGLALLALCLLSIPENGAGATSGTEPQAEIERLQREVSEKIATVSKLKKEIESLKKELEKSRNETKSANERLGKCLRGETAKAVDGAVVALAVTPANIRVSNQGGATTVHYRISLPERPQDFYTTESEREQIRKAVSALNKLEHEKMGDISKVGSEAQLGIYGSGEQRRRWMDKLIKEVNEKYNPEISRAEAELAELKGSVDVKASERRALYESVDVEFRFGGAANKRIDFADLLRKERIRITGTISKIDIANGIPEMGNAPYVSKLTLDGVDATE